MTSTAFIPPIAYTLDGIISSRPIILAPKPIFPPPGFEIEDLIERENWRKYPASEPEFGSYEDDEKLILPGSQDSISPDTDSPKNVYRCAVQASIPIKRRVFVRPYSHFQFSYSYPSYNKPFSHSYKYERYNHFNDRRPRNYRKSAYAVAIVTSDFLAKLDAVKIQEGVYVASKSSTVDSVQEACAIIAVSRSYAEQLFDLRTPIYTILRECPQLQSIAGIKDLSPYRLDILRNTGKTFEDMEPSEFVLFNIEPRGETGRDKRLYPYPNICLPGGGMEPQDNKSWENTLFREFEQEVGIKLQPEDIQIIAQRKSTMAARNAMYFWLRMGPSRAP